MEARANARWSLDFVHDQFACGRRFQVLNVVDDATRECLAAIPDASISGRRVCEPRRSHPNNMNKKVDNYCPGTGTGSVQTRRLQTHQKTARLTIYSLRQHKVTCGEKKVAFLGGEPSCL